MFSDCVENLQEMLQSVTFMNQRRKAQHIISMLYRVVQNKARHFIFILYTVYTTHVQEANVMYQRYIQLMKQLFNTAGLPC